MMLHATLDSTYKYLRHAKCVFRAPFKCSIAHLVLHCAELKCACPGVFGSSAMVAVGLSHYYVIWLVGLYISVKWTLSQNMCAMDRPLHNTVCDVEVRVAQKLNLMLCLPSGFTYPHGRSWGARMCTWAQSITPTVLGMFPKRKKKMHSVWASRFINQVDQCNRGSFHHLINCWCVHSQSQPARKSQRLKGLWHEALVLHRQSMTPLVCALCFGLTRSAVSFISQYLLLLILW